MTSERQLSGVIIAVAIPACGPVDTVRSAYLRHGVNPTVAEPRDRHRRLCDRPGHTGGKP
jgi:hypothetical protein